MKKGFTLTEVLITLIVLGVLALILIPNLAKLMPNDNIIKYQKAFYTLQEAVNDMVNDEDTCQSDEAAAFDNPLQYCYDANGVAKFLDVEICNRLSTTAGTTCANLAGGETIQTTNGMKFIIPHTALTTTFNTSASVTVGLNNDSNMSTVSEANTSYNITINPSGKVIPATADAEKLGKNPTAD